MPSGLVQRRPQYRRLICFQVNRGCFLRSHSIREIDVDWLNQHPHTDLRRHLERYEVNGRRVYLLNRGSLVNEDVPLAVEFRGGGPGVMIRLRGR